MHEPLTVTPIGFVRGGRIEPADDAWASVEAEIVLDAARFNAESLAGLEDFSHVDVVFVFDKLDESEIHLGARRPRGRADWPLVGIFAQRARARPNRIGVTTCELVGVEGTVVKVLGLDAIDGTPVLDIKPYMNGFAPRGSVREPAWARELMERYWT